VQGNGSREMVPGTISLFRNQGNGSMREMVPGTISLFRKIVRSAQ
jgi:hypothetical protein